MQCSFCLTHVECNISAVLDNKIGDAVAKALADSVPIVSCRFVFGLSTKGNDCIVSCSMIDTKRYTYSTKRNDMERSETFQRVTFHKPYVSKLQMSLLSVACHEFDLIT